MFLPKWISGKAERGVYGQSLGGRVDGVLAEYVTLHEDAAAGVPEHLSDAQAATLPCAALTAWTALTSDGGIHAGDTVVLQGTGGVSIAGLQLAKAMGAETIITSSDDAKLKRARELGATHTINYRTTPKWAQKVMEFTGGRGADRVLDVGGADTLPKSVDSLAQNGRVAIIGVLSGYDTPFNLGPVMMRHTTIEGITVGSRSGFEAMCRAISVNRIEPVVDVIYKVEQFREAIEALIAAKHFGKIALTF
jgi:NADPH:quinone reductase-like Zn-dependent oxidoreductase